MNTTILFENCHLLILFKKKKKSTIPLKLA